MPVAVGGSWGTGTILPSNVAQDDREADNRREKKSQRNCENSLETRNLCGIQETSAKTGVGTGLGALTLQSRFVIYSKQEATYAYISHRKGDVAAGRRKRPSAQR